MTSTCNLSTQTRLWARALNTATVREMNITTLLARNPSKVKLNSMPVHNNVKFEHDIDGVAICGKDTSLTMLCPKPDDRYCCIHTDTRAALDSAQTTWADDRGLLSVCLQGRRRRQFDERE